MSNFSVLYDACVLYPAPLRDLLMHLALTDLYRAKWTNEIHDEWIRNVLANRGDLSRKLLERTRDLMNSHVRDCLIDGYQELIQTLSLPDKDDRHVLAAAIHAKCAVIVTYNLKDFPKKTLDKYGIEAQHPDEFITHLIDLSPEAVCVAIRKHRLSLKNPPKTADEYLETLAKQSLNKTIVQLSSLREYI
jgi:predicted nucleic acid-binding protein